MTSDSMTKLMLDGLTTRAATELVPLAKSWLSPPVMVIRGESFQGKGYDPTQRAFVVVRQANAKDGKLHIVLQASNDSPLFDPAIIVENWGDGAPRLRLDGKLVPWNQKYRYGNVYTLQGTNLIVWIELQSNRPTTIDLVASIAK
jgi:hypothetical protein